MSAITGIFYRDGRNVDPQLIKKMNDILSHRGPDGSATWCEGPVGLGHQMLWTTQESLQEKLPLEEDGLVITADARIDNRAELSQELDIEDAEHVADSYFILKAYHKWGEDCPDKLLGDFAFAIWDKNKEQLFCARDHMGVKPFYYYLDDDMFVFGTEIKAILNIPEVPCKSNEKMIAFYLMKIMTDKKLTFYENIFSLTSAHSLSVNQNTNNKQKYWELDPNLKIILNSDEEYVTAFRNIFNEAINCRLRSAFPIGFELSGGMDSSSVVCMAKNILKNKGQNKDFINTYSMIFEDIPQSDESDYIKKVVESGGINSNLIPSDNISPLKNIILAVRYQDQPFNTVNMAILMNMYSIMKKNKIRIILGGSGGDEVISLGQDYLPDLAVNLELRKLIKEIIALSKHLNYNPLILFYKLVFIPMVPNHIKNLKNILLYQTNNEDIVLNKEFVKKIFDENYSKSFRFSSNEVNEKNARKHHYFMINNFSHQKTLEMFDMLASTFSIEPRHPFFDKRLIEFCYGIPNDMKYKTGWSRYILRISMEDILPKEIQWRKSKKDFGAVFEKNLISYEENTLNKIFSSSSPLLKKYINFEYLTNIYQKYRQIHYDKNYSWQPYMYDLWFVLILYYWLKNFKELQK